MRDRIRTKVTNADIRAEMARFGVTQKKLGELLNMAQCEISIMLSRELSKEEQQKIVKIIRKGE